MNSHVIATVGYEAPIVRTGYEYVLAKRNTPMFAYAAEGNGKIVGLTNKGIIVEYEDGKKVGVELGRVYGRAEGSYYPHMIITNLQLGEAVVKDQIVAYNSNFYEQDIYDPNSIIMKSVVYGKVALIESNNTFEDSSAISKGFSSKLVAKTTKVKSIVVRFAQNIHNVAPVGSKIRANDKLMVIEDEITSGYGFDKKALEILQGLAQQAPSAEYNGIIENIEVYYHGELDDMSSSLRELAVASDKKITFARKSSNKTIITGAVNDEYRVDGTPLALDTAEIKVYITVDNSMSVGDKNIIANQMKSVIGEVMDYTVRTENGDTVDGIFGFRSIYARIVLSPILIGTTATLMRVIAKKAVALFRSGK